MVDVLLALLALPLLVPALYLLLLSLASGRLPVPPMVPARLKFVFVVPAHNESAVIVRTVKSLLAVDWPAALRRVVVVADNCQDDTAALARAVGAEVLERASATERGKGYALAHAYEAVLQENWADAVVVIDADTEVTPNLLAAFAARLERGARALQAYSGVLNPQVNWRTRLVTIAMAQMHRVRGRGRERLGVSCGVRGNGMCFVPSVLRQVPPRAFSLVEDLEYSVMLGRASIRIECVDEAEVLAEMVSGNAAAAPQRRRWENGRAQFRREQGWPLIKAAWQQRSAMLLELGVDVLTPPQSTLVLGSLGLLAAGALAWLLGWASLLGVVLALFCLFCIVAHVLRGAALSGLGASAWTTLLAAPGFVAWKVWLKLAGRFSQGQAWTHTQREGEKRGH